MKLINSKFYDKITRVLTYLACFRKEIKLLILFLNFDIGTRYYNQIFLKNASMIYKSF